MKVYDRIMQGLEEAVQYNEGKIKARTNTLEISPIPDFKRKKTKNKLATLKSEPALPQRFNIIAK